MSDNGAGGAFCEAGTGFGAMLTLKHRRADTGDCANREIGAEVFRFRIFGSAKTNDAPVRLSRRTAAGEVKAMSRGADPTESLPLNTCRTDDRLWRKVRVFGIRAHSRERKIRAVGCRRASVNRRLRTSPIRIENRLQRVEDVVDRMGSGVRCPKRFNEVERAGDRESCRDSQMGRPDRSSPIRSECCLEDACRADGRRDGNSVPMPGTL